MVKMFLMMLEPFHTCTCDVLFEVVSVSTDRYIKDRRSKSYDKHRQRSMEYNTHQNKRQKLEDRKCWQFAETGNC